jgi:predicted nuclease of predicted toxin-antitoxin system
VSAAEHAARLGEIWIDAQLPPALAAWLTEWGTPARHVEDLGLLAAADGVIFDAARRAKAIVVTKDEDFVQLLEAQGPPPQVVWVTVGNVRNARLRSLFERHWPAIAEQVTAGEPLTELSESPPVSW